MKLLSLFSGIGAFEKALDRLNINYDLVGFSEIDKYAVKSYCAIHGVPESMNLGDITKIDEKELPKDIDLITYGFPCQDISLAGKQKGLFNDDGTQTRSGLFFEALRIIEETQPRVAIAENVKNLTSKKFSEQFKIVLDSLEQAGYNNYWQVLNAKDYGIPQNRERVFIVSIRKDIDTGVFQFYEGFHLELRLKDLLEEEADEKFYLSNKMKNYLFDITEKNKARGNGNVYKACDVNGTSKAITTKEESRVKDNFIEEPSVLQIGNCCPTKTRDNPNQGRIYDTEGLAPCLNQMCGGNRQPFVTIREATTKGYAEAFEGDSVNLEQPNSKTRRGRVGKQVAQTLTTSPQQGVVIGKVEPLNPMPDGTCRTIKNQYYKTSNANYERTGSMGATGVTNGISIRKLTPKECFRLMDFDDSDFDKAEAVSSNTQLYKQAGNSIVVAVLYYIIKALFEANIFIEKEKKEMELKINEYQLPEKISFNFEELKCELQEKVSHYETLVYTDEQIQEAKKDKANLNKLKKALNDERIRREKEYMQPFNDFKAKINEIIGIIDKPVSVIDRQVKEYEEKQKQDKLAKIQEYYNGIEKPELQWLGLPAIYNEKWLNASVSMKSIQEEINARLEQIKNDLATLSNLPEFGFEATEVYKTSLDMNKAISEAQRMSQIQKAKAEAEAKKAEYEATQAAKLAEQVAEVEIENAMNPQEAEIIEPAKQWIKFAALLTTDDALALKDFFNSRNIEFKAI